MPHAPVLDEAPLYHAQGRRSKNRTRMTRISRMNADKTRSDPQIAQIAQINF
jgi:hypothetical protein